MILTNAATLFLARDGKFDLVHPPRGVPERNLVTPGEVVDLFDRGHADGAGGDVDDAAHG